MVGSPPPRRTPDANVPAAPHVFAPWAAASPGGIGAGGLIELQALRLLVSAIAMLGAAGCGCGVAADPAGTTSAAGTVDSNGTVHFTAIASGTTESFPIPIKETAATSETIASASLTGSGASSFQILAQFPIDVPDGKDVTVEVEFAPPIAGSFEAELLLATSKMGTSQVPLVGTGL